MSDSLVLKGLKDVRKHKGSEMLLQRSKRGGDVYPVKKWWALNASQVTYAPCSVFKVTQNGLSAYLAITTADFSSVRIDSSEGFTFNFYGIHHINRGALFNENWELIEHYVFPKISGGKIMTVTPAGAARRPEIVNTVEVSAPVVIPPADVEETEEEVEEETEVTEEPDA